MPDQTISFICPNCGINLTVPANLAGITGPCPSCKTEIQAPQETLESSFSVAAPVELPKVTRSIFGSILWPIILVLLGVMGWLFLNSSPKKPEKKSSRLNSPPSGIAVLLEKKSSLEPLNEPNKNLIAQPPVVEPLPPEKPVPQVQMSAREVLDRFLTAKSFSDRSSILETQTPQFELANSCLATAFPSTRLVEIDIKDRDSSEQVIDIYYRVDFSGTTVANNAQTILIRKRGNDEPKVVIDPFLDTYGGRLAGFANAPTDRSRVFCVIVSALAVGGDEIVPNREEKFTLQLLSRAHTKEIARAYFSKNSSIGKLLEDDSFRLSFGKAKAGTVTLKWNTEENPKLPFLEVTELDTSGWDR